VKPSRHNARVELRDRSDAALSTAEFTFFVYSRPAPVHSTLYVMNEDALAPALQTRGYRTAETHAPVMVASKWSPEVEAQLNAGRSAILPLNSADALPANFAVQLKTRNRNNYNGDWISNFNWIMPSSPVFNEIAFNKIMGWEA